MNYYCLFCVGVPEEVRKYRYVLVPGLFTSNFIFRINSRVVYLYLFRPNMCIFKKLLIFFASFIFIFSFLILLFFTNLLLFIFIYFSRVSFFRFLPRLHGDCAEAFASEAIRCNQGADRHWWLCAEKR